MLVFLVLLLPTFLGCRRKKSTCFSALDPPPMHGPPPGPTDLLASVEKRAWTWMRLYYPVQFC